MTQSRPPLKDKAYYLQGKEEMKQKNYEKAKISFARANGYEDADRMMQEAGNKSRKKK